VIGTEELLVKFRQLTTEVQGEALVNTVQAGGTVIVNAAKENIKKQGLIRTRTLRGSVHQEVTERDADHAAVDVGTNLEYAAIHEFGGTIQAKSSKYLAIPVGSYKGSPRKHADLKLRKTAGGNLVMVDPSGIVQYVLKRSVEIPARPYLRPAFDESHEKVKSEMASAWRQQIEKAAT
jgi:HK97 gp10 family phage protein